MPRAANLHRRQFLSAATASAALAALPHATAMTAARETAIVDSHVHVWKNDPRYPWPAEETNPPAEDALPETLLARMDACGVANTVIVHVIYYRWDCRYAADVVKQYPRRFEGVCRVDPQSASADDDLRSWVEQWGYRGVRLSPANGPSGDWIGDQKRVDRIVTTAAELKVPLCFLCPIERIPDVEQVIARHDGALDVCIDHMADCPIDQPSELAKLLRLARYRRVTVKISHLWSLSHEAWPYRDTWPQVRQLYDAFGPQRLMWGSDWPMCEKYCPYEKTLAIYRDEIDFFSDADRRSILGETARTLWSFA